MRDHVFFRENGGGGGGGGGNPFKTKNKESILQKIDGR